MLSTETKTETVVDADDPSLRPHNSGNALFGLPRPTFHTHNPR